MAEPALWAPMDIANLELDADEEDWIEGDEDEYGDSDEEEMREENNPIIYQICEVISTMVISIFCTLAVYGVEKSLESWKDSKGELPTQLISQLKLWTPAIMVPTLFLVLPESLGYVRRNACFVVYAFLLAPFLLLPWFISPPCSGPDAPKKPLARQISITDWALSDGVYSLLAWTFWYGPVLLISIICAIRLFKTENMAPHLPELPEPAPPDASGLLRDRARG